MRISLAPFILRFCFYLSLVRGTNIGLFYPPDEANFSQIDYRFQLAANIVLLLGIIAYFFLKNDYSFFKEKLSRPYILLLLAIGGLSLLTSVNHTESAKFVLAVAVISFPTVLYRREFGNAPLSRAWGYFIMAMAFANLAYTALYPHYGIMSGNHEGQWRGLFEHKNGAGVFFAVGFFILLFQLKFLLSARTVLQFLAITICLLFVALSYSSTGLVIFGVLTLLIPVFSFLYRLRPPERLIVFFTGASLCLLIGAVFGQDLLGLIFSVLGKDETLTGRTGIWKVAYDLGSRRPFTGFGPGMSERVDFMAQIQAELSWDAKSTHNSYLDLMLCYGYPMTILLPFYILKSWLGTLMHPVDYKSCVNSRVLGSALILAMLVFCFSGSSALIGRSIFWLVMLYGLSLIAKPNREELSETNTELA